MTVLAPTVKKVELELKLWAEEDRDFEAVAGTVRQTLKDWFNGERLGQPLLRAQLTSLVFGVDGVANCVFVQPEADLPLNSRTLPVLNSVKLVKGKEMDVGSEAKASQQSETGSGKEAGGTEH